MSSKGSLHPQFYLENNQNIQKSKSIIETLPPREKKGSTSTSFCFQFKTYSIVNGTVVWSEIPRHTSYLASGEIVSLMKTRL